MKTVLYPGYLLEQSVQTWQIFRILVFGNFFEKKGIFNRIFFSKKENRQKEIRNHQYLTEL
jgi:hypothetical protein